MNPSFVGCDKGDRSVVERSCSLQLRLFNVNRFFAFSLIGDRIEKKLKIWTSDRRNGCLAKFRMIDARWPAPISISKLVGVFFGQSEFASSSFLRMK
jgi:hypothetical protein